MDALTVVFSFATSVSTGIVVGYFVARLTIREATKASAKKEHQDWFVKAGQLQDYVDRELREAFRELPNNPQTISTTAWDIARSHPGFMNTLDIMFLSPVYYSFEKYNSPSKEVVKDRSADLAELTSQLVSLAGKIDWLVHLKEEVMRSRRSRG